MRTVEWDEKTGVVSMIDQRLLPAEFKIVRYDHYQQVADAIRDMVVRGAPAIGASAAFGMALAAVHSKAENPDHLKADLESAARLLTHARPTAINLKWAIDRIWQKIKIPVNSADELRSLIISEATTIANEDVETNKRMAAFGATLISDGDTVIHHCNTGALAAVDWGTALGVIRKAHEQGKLIHVLVDETRPRLQGARLTAWELDQYGISYEIITDNAAGYFLRNGVAQKVIFGADRIASNGDVANKIGTYMLALAAFDNEIPSYSVAPISTIDFSIEHGGFIPIEERDPEEVLDLHKAGVKVVPEGAKARNPAFDVTPHRLISAIVTEKGIIYPPFTDNLSKIIKAQEN